MFLGHVRHVYKDNVVHVNKPEHCKERTWVNFSVSGTHIARPLLTGFLMLLSSVIGHPWFIKIHDN